MAGPNDTLREVQRYSLVEVDREKGLSRLTRDGRPLGFVANGVVLEAQYELRDGRGLVWLTADCPYEEGLHVYLLGPGGEVEDVVEAGAMYAPGILKIRAAGADWVEVGFFLNGFVYRLEIGERARLRMPLPIGWRYGRWLARHRLSVTVSRTEPTVDDPEPTEGP
ncbi:MAG TPA: hypothetical protein VK447_03590 [Myxococcaceae bacterium]|nr:hypothetical protein [Myxococcaceae bacterium]